jgi:hypothetical protein
LLPLSGPVATVYLSAPNPEQAISLYRFWPISQLYIDNFTSVVALTYELGVFESHPDEVFVRHPIWRDGIEIIPITVLFFSQGEAMLSQLGHGSSSLQRGVESLCLASRLSRANYGFLNLFEDFIIHCFLKIAPDFEFYILSANEYATLGHRITLKVTTPLCHVGFFVTT